LFWNCLATAATGEPDMVTERLTWSPDLCVPVQLNGATVKLAISSDDAVAIELNPEAALRAKLVAKGLEHFFGVRIVMPSVDPTIESFARIRTQTVRILDHSPERVAVTWHERTRIHASCDGFVSIWLVAASRVSLVQAAAPPSTRNVVISVTSDRTWVPGYEGHLDIGGESFRAALDLTAPDTVVNAPAARRLARDGRLRLSGEVRMHLVRYGGERPAEVGQFVDFKPFGFTIPEVYAHGARVTPLSHGPDEVAPVVVEARPPKETARPAITLGYKALASCRSLTFDRTTHTITLACAE
jgi:hypothetical protein